MGIGALSARNEALLREVLDRRPTAPTALRLSMDRVLSGTPSADDVDAVQDSILDEFISAGLNPDGEPNEYGHRLEDLIDVVTRLSPRWH